jgi:hypothetical protein
MARPFSLPATRWPQTHRHIGYASTLPQEKCDVNAMLETS